MAKQYYSVLTDYGTQVIAGAIASKQPLQITQMAVGDGEGRTPTPDSRKTGLVREMHRADISAISVDPRNDKQIIFELTIPENVGGFWIREMGIFDNQNRLVAYANCPDSFKPELTSGSGKVQVVRMILLVSSSDAITLKVDDSVIFVTRGQLTPKAITATTKNAVDETGHSHEIDKASTSQAGIVELDSSINSKAENKAATPKAVKTAYDKAEAANDNANTRVSKSGGEMTGGLKLKANYGTSEKKWDYSGFYAGSAALNNEALPYFQIHIGSYGGNTAGYAKSLGFNLTDYKAYVMNWNSEGEYAGKKEILTELHRSDSVTSASSETVATSKAVKTAYDKAKAADDNANTRVSKSGGTVTGDIFIKRGDWSAVNCINSAGNLLMLEVNPESDSKSFGALIYRNGANGGNISKLSLPKVSGTLITKEDVGKTYRPLSDNAFDAKYGGLRLISQTGNYAQLHLGGTDCTVIFEQQPDSKDCNLSIFTEKNGARPYGYFNIPKKGGMAITDKDYQCKTGKNGWLKLPNGVILQWFEGGLDRYKIKNNRFPIPFPNSCFHVFATDLAYGNTAERISVRSWNNSGVDVYGMDGSGSVSLFAIGN